MISAKVIADSIARNNRRITTLQLAYPRFVHAEFMTHRVFSRNASSSRAEPVHRHIERISRDPAIPIHWGANEPGMQARAEISNKQQARRIWNTACQDACAHAKQLADLGVHKQVVNRMLEPFSIIHVIVTSTEWDNFFALRMHPDAQPEMQALALEMNTAILESTPAKCGQSDWHLPYVTPEEARLLPMHSLKNISAARCARVSYLNHDGTDPDIEKDVDLAHKLISGRHMSPFEHQATPTHGRAFNLDGWYSYRYEMEES